MLIVQTESDFQIMERHNDMHESVMRIGCEMSTDRKKVLYATVNEIPSIHLPFFSRLTRSLNLSASRLWEFIISFMDLGDKFGGHGILWKASADFLGLLLKDVDSFC